MYVPEYFRVNDRQAMLEHLAQGEAESQALAALIRQYLNLDGQI